MSQIIAEYTTKYKNFTFLSGNRPISQWHVQEIVTSFQANPALIELRPILVNEDMGVIDGQHRLKALEFLKLPVPYIKSPGLTIQTAQIMNALQRPWKLIDFANSYAESGNNNYQLFLRYLHDYAPLTSSVLIRYLGNKGVYGKQGSHNQNFKNGKFVFPQAEEADQKLGRLRDAGEHVPFWYQEPFAMAFRIMMNIKGYDHDQFLAALPRTKVLQEPRTLDQLRELERVYNYKKSDITRFF